MDIPYLKKKIWNSIYENIEQGNKVKIIFLDPRIDLSSTETLKEVFLKFRDFVGTRDNLSIRLCPFPDSNGRKYSFVFLNKKLM